MAQTSTLRQLGFSARLGLTLIVLTLLGGLTVSGIYMAVHHENRDEQAGLTMTDIRGTVASAIAVSIFAPARMMPSRSTFVPIMKPGTSAK